MSSPPPRDPAVRPPERPLQLPTDIRAMPRVPAPAPPAMPLRLPPQMRRELIVYGVLLLFGLIGVPLLIWVGGNRVLGPYTHDQSNRAGPLALLQDFFLGLLHGSAVFWVVALGPAALVLLVRLFIRLVRAMPGGEREMPSARRSGPPGPPGASRRGR